MNLKKIFFQEKYQHEIEKLKRENYSLHKDLKAWESGRRKDFWYENGMLIFSVVVIASLAFGIYKLTDRREAKPISETKTESVATNLTDKNSCLYESEIRRLYDAGYKNITIYNTLKEWSGKPDFYLTLVAKKEVKTKESTNKLSVEKEFSSEKEMVDFLKTVK